MLTFVKRMIRRAYKMANGAKETYIDVNYVLDEMHDSINQTISNMRSIIDSQTQLVGYLEKAKNEKFNDFIKQLKDANADYEKQTKVLAHRLSCIDKAKELLASIDAASYFLSMLLDAFGVVNKEGKSVEERINNKETAKEFCISYKA